MTVALSWSDDIEDKRQAILRLLASFLVEMRLTVRTKLMLQCVAILQACAAQAAQQLLQQ
jgi:hypothetical protein